MMSHRSLRYFILISLLLMLVFWAGSVRAESADSSSFKLLEGRLAPGAYLNSSNFQLNGLFSQLSIGISQASDFVLRSGLLYFPTISTPVISATAGDGQVALSWTPSTGILGWRAGAYVVGWATSGSGPFTLVDNGLSTSYTKTGLSNGTDYYFLIKVKDTLGNYVATSTTVSAKPVASGGGGGGGGGGATGGANAVFRGRAFPSSDVSLFRDGQLLVTTKAGPDANFQISVSNLNPGLYNFGVNSTDNSGRQSLLQTFPVTISGSTGVLISGIFIAPSIAVDKQTVKQGDNLAILGQSVPNARVTIAVNSENQIFAQAPTDRAGVYLYNLDTSPLEMGGHSAKSKASVLTELSPFGPTVGFRVGSENIDNDSGPTCPLKGDLNNDCRVNLVDFSIAAYWYKRPLSPAFLALERSKLSGDSKLTLTDFSIMAYYWTK